MNHFDLIQRALRIVWRYKVLWIFGILLALTGGGGGSGSGWQFGSGGNGGGPPPGGMESLPWELPNFAQFAAMAGAFLLCCCCLLLILMIVGIIVRYVAQAALYRMVDEIETTGNSPTWREGFRLGWSDRTFRLWLLELLVGIVFFLGALVLALPVLSPLLLLFSDNDGLRAFGGIVAALLGILLFLVLLIAGAVVSGLKQFWGREVVLADRSVGEALASGFRLVQRHFKDVFLMWLLMLGIGLLFGLLLIPVGFVVLGIGAVVGGGLGWLTYQLTESVGWAVAIGMPPFLLLTVVPFALIGGLYATFESSAWTLAYRDVIGRNEDVVVS